MSQIFPRERREGGKTDTESGFTILEVLVAFGILAIILGLLFEAIRQTDMTIAHVERKTLFERKMEVVRYLLRNEVLSTYLNQNDPLTLFMGFPNRTDGRETDTILFTTLGQTRLSQGAPISHLEGVEYMLFVNPSSPYFTLVHQQNTNLLSYGTQAVIPETILSRVWSFRIRYFDGMLWTDRWNSAQNHSLPLLVRFDIVVVNKKKEKEKFFEEIQIPSALSGQVQGGGNQIPEGSGSTGN